MIISINNAIRICFFYIFHYKHQYVFNCFMYYNKTLHSFNVYQDQQFSNSKSLRPKYSEVSDKRQNKYIHEHFKFSYDYVRNGKKRKLFVLHFFKRFSNDLS